VTILSAVVVTSLHAQDFCDVVGDRAMGRTTLPILYPEASRLVTCATVVAWSVILPIYWHAGPTAAAALLSAGAFVAWRFWYLRTAAADRRSYVYYNVRGLAVVCKRGLTDGSW
jgi:4-hydroxybenzoate polyprenyltransferase